jgi:KDO2-lipid IV(A) lauroyltransferase
MQYIGFLFFLLFVNVFRFVPYSVLYVFSDFLFWVLTKIVKYRKEVIYGNLRRCFPEKTETEINSIADKFYHHFCDITVESMKGFTLGKEELMRRASFTNVKETIDVWLEKGIPVIAAPAHYNNWEYPGLAAGLYSRFPVDILYKPLTNKLIDVYFRKKRRSWGAEFWSIYETKEFFEQSKGRAHITVMASDQSPGNVSKAIWVNFFGIETAFLHGPEFYARQNGCALAFGHVRKVRRGHYEIDLIPYAEPPYEHIPYGELTQLYASKLEEIIREKPEFWLWSHKRWKHTKS